MEVVGLQLMNHETTETAKSARKFHTFLLYLGKEDYTTLQKELANALPKINEISEAGKMSIMVDGEEKEVDVEIYLVCDLAALVDVMGLNSVFHPKSHYKCPWCLVTLSELHDMTKKRWEWRDIKKMVEIAKSISHLSERILVGIEQNTMRVLSCVLVPIDAYLADNSQHAYPEHATLVDSHSADYCLLFALDDEYVQNSVA